MQPRAQAPDGEAGWLDQAVGSFGTCSCAEMQPGMCLFAFAGSSVKAPKPATNGASAMMKRAVRVCISAQEGGFRESARVALGRRRYLQVRVIGRPGREQSA